MSLGVFGVASPSKKSKTLVDFFPLAGVIDFFSEVGSIGAVGGGLGAGGGGRVDLGSSASGASSTYGFRGTTAERLGLSRASGAIVTDFCFLDLGCFSL